jgi:hypothetical protein
MGEIGNQVHQTLFFLMVSLFDISNESGDTLNPLQELMRIFMTCRLDDLNLHRKLGSGTIMMGRRNFFEFRRKIKVVEVLRANSLLQQLIRMSNRNFIIRGAMNNINRSVDIMDPINCSIFKATKPSPK